MTMSGMLICGYLWIAFGVLWLVWALRNKPTVRRRASGRDSHTSSPRWPPVTRCSAAMCRWAGCTPASFPREPGSKRSELRSPSAGMAFAIWARAYLGGNWSSNVTVKVGHQLIRTGPYRWVRHPIYSGLIVAMIGTALNRRAGTRSGCGRPALGGLHHQKPDRRALHGGDLRAGIRRVPPRHRSAGAASQVLKSST